MNPTSAVTTTPVLQPPSAKPEPFVTLDSAIRLGVTVAILLVYYGVRGPVSVWLTEVWEQSARSEVKRETMAVWLVVVVLLAVVGLWQHVLRREKRFHAPLLVTAVLLIGDAAFSILESHSSPLLESWTAGLLTGYTPTFLVIFTTVMAEMFLGRWFYGKWPHLASAYVSGISAGILIKSPELWPFVMCGLISITSKYVLRIGDRHLWNPTNLGVTLMLLLAPLHVASLSVEAGNEIWAVLVIWILGGIIMTQLGRWHISLAFTVAFIPLAFLRAWVTENDWRTELAPITSPMFQLYIFFMITDPKTTTKARWSQVLVAVLVAIAETVYRLAFRDLHSLYHALFTVGPISNLIEIAYHRDAKPKPATQAETMAPNLAVGEAPPGAIRHAADLGVRV